jgi:hypothetical protein
MLGYGLTASLALGAVWTIGNVGQRKYDSYPESTRELLEKYDTNGNNHLDISEVQSVAEYLDHLESRYQELQPNVDTHEAGD